jgi:hypothetical protein
MKIAIKTLLKCFLFLLIFYTPTASAQRLYFCKAVSPEGDPVGLSNLFTVNQESNSISALVKLSKHIEVSEVEFRIYRLLGNGDEVVVSTVPFKVDGSWFWFWKELKFYEQGSYKVYLFAGNEKPLCSETLDIFKE